MRILRKPVHMTILFVQQNTGDKQHFTLIKGQSHQEAERRSALWKRTNLGKIDLNRLATSHVPGFQAPFPLNPDPD